MNIEEFCGKIKDLPALPVVVHQVNAAAMKDDVTAHDLGEIIEKDPVLAGKLLKLANSSYYGLVREVSTIERAVTLLGFVTVKNFATSVSVSGMLAKSKKSIFDVKGLWLHALGCAVAADILVSRLKNSQGDEAFLCGILHDIGSSVLINNFSDQMEQVSCLMELRAISQSDAEREILGVTHGEIGSHLAFKWKFPKKYQRVIELHHQIPPSSLDMNDSGNIMLVAVHVGNQLVKSLQIGKSFDSAASDIEPQVWSMLGVNEEDLAGIKEQIVLKTEEVRKAFE